MSKIKDTILDMQANNKRNQIIEDASLSYLELGEVSKQTVFNPFLNPEFNDKNLFIDSFTQFIRNPANLHFACKEILNLDVVPVHMAILQMLWTKQFPMLIASRGFAKSFTSTYYLILRALLDPGCKIVVVGAAYRQALILFNYLTRIWNSSPILQDIVGKKNSPKRGITMAYWECGESTIKFLPLGDGETIRGERAGIILCEEFGCLCPLTLVETNLGLIRIGERPDIKNFDINNGEKFVKADKYIITKPRDVYKITTKYGYNFECSDIHQVMTSKGFKLAKDLTNEDHLIFENTYKFPDKNVTVDDKEINEDIAWLLGILISEGCVRNESISQIYNTDIRVINKIQKICDTLGIKHHLYFANEYYDKRLKSNCKKLYNIHISDRNFRSFLNKAGLDFSTALNKKTPWSILQSPRNIVISYLSGLFEGDGSAFTFMDNYKKSKNRKCLGVSYYSSSKQLINETHILLHKLDCLGSLNSKKSKLTPNPVYFIRMSGVNAKKIYDELDVIKFKDVDLKDVYFSDKFYKEDKGIFFNNQHGKYQINLLESGKVKFHGLFNTKEEALEKLNQLNVLKTLRVRSVEKLKEQKVLYDYHIPEGHKFLANSFIQHNSVNTEIFETVIRGFAAVKTTNFIENIKTAYKNEFLKQSGLDDGVQVSDKIPTSTSLGGNQIIIQGTATFQFSHFYKYFKQYKAIIESGGDQEYVNQNYPDLDLDVTKLDTSQYAIMRLPYHLAPKGMMDLDILEQGRATMVRQIFDQEYGCCFPSDSDGFYPASLIFSCTCPLKNSNGVLNHSARMSGQRELKYVMGIDPASEDDNFAISIMEDYGTYRVLVYTWSTSRKRFNQLKEEGMIHERIRDYNTFCIKHIRALVRRFNIDSIICDAGGGGVSLKEGLQDQDKMEDNELAIYDKDDENYSHLTGLHILKMVNFQDGNWRKEAHYGLKKDLEDRRLLFPEFDTVAAAQSEKLEYTKKYESLDECYLEIESAKQEMICIKRTETGSGQERWDVPNISVLSYDDTKKKLKKDRFTSILLANWGVRLLHDENLNKVVYSPVGTTRHNKSKNNNDKPAYINTQGKKLRIISSSLVDGL